ncbi:MAG TPA: peptidoglycan-associated lipoprotein Pal [Thermoanaerobaculia bacterium]|nr:peptidoglycan-associated lipoprotein Pal [Thermoanaerobaculia bacterium]
MRFSRACVILLCFVALIGCRHHQTVAPVTAPMAAAAAPAPEVHVAPANKDFVSPTVETDPLADLSHATDVAEQRGWLRDAFFDFDSSELRPDAQQNLTQSATFLKSHPKFDVLIEGHCDERGTEQYNLALGEHRAYQAKEYLATLGYDASRMKTISYGKDRPFDTGHDEEAWAKNRRAHLVLESAQ